MSAHPKSSREVRGAVPLITGRVYRRVCLGLLFVAGVAGCRDQRAPDAVVPDARAPVEEPDVADSVVALTPSTYDRRLGPLLLVPIPGDATGTLASVLSPLLAQELPVTDTVAMSERIGNGLVTLYGRHGAVADRMVSQIEVSATGECAVWPTGRLAAPASDSATSLPRGWLVGLATGRVQAVSLDSIEAMPARDSATLAATLARLASGVPEDSGRAFRGLPFRVTRAYRTRGLAESFVIGELVRRVPQEDRPLEERLFVVVSTPTTDANGWRIAWHERVAGREEEVIASEPLVVVQAGSPAVVSVYLRRDDGTGTSLALLQRAGGRWRVRWESPITGC